MYLEREGYKVEEAENGEEALEMALEKDYHCILLDIMMPEKDGIEDVRKYEKERNANYFINSKRGRGKPCTRV